MPTRYLNVIFATICFTYQQVVDMWIEEYKTNREAALVQLMQFFINASGCRGKVTPDMAQMDHTLIIKKMTQEFDEVFKNYIISLLIAQFI